jgi:hypothetical protein
MGLQILFTMDRPGPDTIAQWGQHSGVAMAGFPGRSRGGKVADQDQSKTITPLTCSKQGGMAGWIFTSCYKDKKLLHEVWSSFL